MRKSSMNPVTNDKYLDTIHIKLKILKQK